MLKFKWSWLLPLMFFAVQGQSQTLQGTVADDSFLGPITNKTVYYSIYLPPGYETTAQRYPVIYHLHGRTAKYNGSQTTTVPPSFEAARDAGIIGPVIIVFPDGYASSMWADSWGGAKPAETNLVKELIPHVDSLYRTFADREHRIVTGFSMGGFGVAKFAAKYPDLFRAGINYDGALHSWQTLNDIHPDIVREIFNDNETYFNQFSPWTFVAQNDSLLKTAVALRSVVGELIQFNRPFRDTLQNRGIPLDYVETICDHSQRCMLDEEGLNSAAFIANLLVTGIESSGTIPEDFLLYQNFPNPFNPGTTIRFNLRKSQPVTLKVFDVLGNEVAVLVNEKLPAGEQTVVLDGRTLSSGLYFYQLRTGQQTQARRAVLLK